VSEGFELHAQLARDTATIGDLPLSRVLVINDANYPWLLLVPRRPKVVEILDLDEVAQAQLMTEINRVSRALRSVTECDKLNIAALGNVVPQLHVHIIARFRSDPAWPRPVWGVVPPREYTAEEYQRLAGPLRRQIWLS
jgi:diadenosine tetraphosphate (Ap4A) HIT family hydrolase